jgi:hypothetical protein
MVRGAVKYNPPASEHKLVHGCEGHLCRLGAVELDEAEALVLRSGSILLGEGNMILNTGKGTSSGSKVWCIAGIQMNGDRAWELRIVCVPN